MRFSLCCCLALLLALCSAAAQATSDADAISTAASKHALLVSIPLPVSHARNPKETEFPVMHACTHLTACSSLVCAVRQGHCNPLLAQGFELRRRGWTVSIASPSRMQKHIERAISGATQRESTDAAGKPLPPMNYVNLGDCAAVAQLAETVARAADHEDYLESQMRTRMHSMSADNAVPMLTPCALFGVVDRRA